MIAVLHRDAYYGNGYLRKCWYLTGCWHPAFYLTQQLTRGQIIAPEAVRLLDGSTPKRGDRMLCGSCGAKLGTVAEDEAGCYAVSVEAALAVQLREAYKSGL